jgi:hypothetical protein
MQRISERESRMRLEIGPALDASFARLTGAHLDGSRPQFVTKREPSFTSAASTETGDNSDVIGNRKLAACTICCVLPARLRRRQEYGNSVPG